MAQSQNHESRRAYYPGVPYELCRAYFLEGATADRLAQRFKLHVGTVRAIVRDFVRDPDINSFFTADRPGPKTSPKRTAIHQRACELRRQGATLAEICATLLHEGFDVSESYLFRVLHRAGLTTTRHHRSTPQPGEYANDRSRCQSVLARMATSRSAMTSPARYVSTASSSFP